MANASFDGVSEVSKASRHRLEDARVLLAAGQWRGAMYIAGYPVELRLKTKLMQKFGCRNLRELDEELHRRGVLAETGTIYTHRFDVLLAKAQVLSLLQQNPPLWRSFTGVVNRWVPAWRYNANPATREEATAFVEAVEILLRWIDNNM